MISKNQIKHIRSLHKSKGRNKSRLFLVEGPKAVEEFLESSFKIQQIFATRQWTEKMGDRAFNVEEISEKELQSISVQKHPNQVLAIVEMPAPPPPPENIDDLCLVLDTIQDPGNLGTIIRIADWFGIKHIICSKETADIYNPKVVQSTMGSLGRVKISYTDLPQWLGNFNGKLPIYGSLLSGDNLYKSELSSPSLLIIGNESKGISEDVAFYISKAIKIPAWGDSKTESLNAAVATGILVAAFRQANRT